MALLSPSMDSFAILIHLCKFHDGQTVPTDEAPYLTWNLFSICTGNCQSRATWSRCIPVWLCQLWLLLPELMFTSSQTFCREISSPLLQRLVLCWPSLLPLTKVERMPRPGLGCFWDFPSALVTSGCTLLDFNGGSNKQTCCSSLIDRTRIGPPPWHSHSYQSSYHCYSFPVHCSALHLLLSLRSVLP